MGRKVGLCVAVAVIAVISAAWAGGQAVGGYLWWGDREPIYIYGDDDFTVDNGVTSGSGTAADPYVIEGWQIVDPCADYGIYIDHTTRHFVIRRCIVERARIAAVYFNTASNGRVEDCQLTRSDAAVYLMNGYRNVIEGNLIAEDRYGIVMGPYSRENLIRRNAFVDNGMHALDHEGRNLWFCDCVGNYWSGHDAPDVNGDGIVDRPYYSVDDRYPLAGPPVEPYPTPHPLSALVERDRATGSWFVVTSTTPIELTGIDSGTGIARICFRIDGGEWVTYRAPLCLIGPDGPRVVEYCSLDRLGNRSAIRGIHLYLSNTPAATLIEVGDPSLRDTEGLWVTSRTPIRLRVAYGAADVSLRSFYRIDGGPWIEYATPFFVIGCDGVYTIAAYSLDVYGNRTPTEWLTVRKDDAPPTIWRQGESVPHEVLYPNVPCSEGPPTGVGTATPEAVEEPAVVVPEPERVQTESVGEPAVVTPESEPVQTGPVEESEPEQEIVDLTAPLEAAPVSPQTAPETDTE